MPMTLRGTMVWTPWHGRAMDIRWGEGEVGEGEVVPGDVMDCFSFTSSVGGGCLFSCADRV